MLTLLAVIACLALLAGLVIIRWTRDGIGPVLATAGFMLLLILSCFAANAHDRDSSHDGWYASLMQPDNPTASCCGVADAYWCDDISVEGGKTFCKITDDQEIGGRPKLPLGTKIEIPDRKLKWDRGNPTGHAIVFLSAGGAVYCFVQGAGI